MADVFEVQDEIARKIAEALRVQLSPQEQEALAAKPTENLQAYDLYLRGKSYARRLTRQDLEFALQMFENAVSLDPRFALAHAAIANVVRALQPALRPRAAVDRARQGGEPEGERPRQRLARDPGGGGLDPLRRGQVRRGRAPRARRRSSRKADAEGAYYLLGRALFAAGQYQEVVDLAEAAIAASGEDYNIYVPIHNALGALGKKEALRNAVLQRIQVLEAHLRKFPEDARGRTLLATDYAHVERVDDAVREASLAMALRANDAMVLYNVACVFGQLGKKPETLDALRKARDAGWNDATWARRDPDLAIAPRRRRSSRSCTRRPRRASEPRRRTP